MSNEWQDLPNMAAVCAVQADRWYIEVKESDGTWIPWLGNVWSASLDYRGRPKQPKTEKVTLECWMHGSTGSTCTRKAELNDDLKTNGCWQRFPAGDIEGEVEQ